MRVLGEIVAGLIISLIGTVVTLGVANGLFDQSWDFGPVFGIWLLIVFVGVAIFHFSDGEIDLGW